jgi:hypothetical protein
VRFNPNLYNCGKVCLSLLGTWQGQPWVANESTMLQVLVSIQALILVPHPMLNEPGWENRMHSKESNEYNAERKVATLKWAMLDQIQHPKPGFEDITRLHFLLKRDEILAQMKRWVAEETANASRFVEEMKTMQTEVSAALSALH